MLDKIIHGVEIDDDLRDLFDYHPPTEEQKEQYARIRDACAYAAQVIRDNSPACARQTIALQHVVDARMSANAAVATRGADLAPPCGYRSCGHRNDVHTGQETARGFACTAPGCDCTGYVTLAAL